MTEDDYNVYDHLRKMWRTTDRELNRVQQDEILERLESYYDVVPR